MKPRYILIIMLTLCMLAALLPAAALADNDDMDLDPELRALLEGQEEVEVYQFPEIEPRYSAALGIRTVDYTGPSSLLRFGELEDTVIFSGQYRAFWFPSRFFVVYDRISDDDYFGELRYALGDSIFLRWVGSGLHRNPESVVPVDLDTSSAFFGVSVGDAGVQYGVGKNTEDIFLRFKAPDFPAHLFLRAWMVHEDGTIQERSLLGSGWYNELVRDSSKREYSWETHSYTVGANSHLGPVEIEVEHTDDQFKMNSAPASTSFYSAGGGRSAGFYDHHLYSGFKGSENSIEMHTSFTGRLVASASLAARTMENETKGGEADYLFGSAGITWMPSTSLTLVLRYRHSDLDYDDSVQLASTDIINAPRSGMSTVKDDVSLTARFRPIPALVVRAKYRRQSTERDGALAWGLSSDKTVKDSYTISGRSRQIKNLTIKADYTYATTEDPAYNTEGDISHRVKASADWKTTRRTMTFVSVLTEASKRHGLDYGNSVKADNRLSYKDQARAGVTLVGSEKFTVTGSLNYYLNSVKQDLIYNSSDPMQPGLADTVYEDRVYGAAVDMSYLPTEKLSMTAGLSVSHMEGEFKTHNQDLLAPVPVSSLVDQDVTITQLDIGGTYELPMDMALGFSYMLKEMSEDRVNPYDSLSDGDVQVAILQVSKKW